MKRTVKAWGRIHHVDLGIDKHGPLCPSSIRWERVGSTLCVAGDDLRDEWLRVTITYDDGRPSPTLPKRTKGGKRG